MTPSSWTADLISSIAAFLMPDVAPGDFKPGGQTYVVRTLLSLLMLAIIWVFVRSIR